jgi:hypothetical protein
MGEVFHAGASYENSSKVQVRLRFGLLALSANGKRETANKYEPPTNSRLTIVYISFKRKGLCFKQRPFVFFTFAVLRFTTIVPIMS